MRREYRRAPLRWIGAAMVLATVVGSLSPALGALGSRRCCSTAAAGCSGQVCHMLAERPEAEPATGSKGAHCHSGAETAVPVGPSEQAPGVGVGATARGHRHLVITLPSRCPEPIASLTTSQVETSALQPQGQVQRNAASERSPACRRVEHRPVPRTLSPTLPRPPPAIL